MNRDFKYLIKFKGKYGSEFEDDKLEAFCKKVDKALHLKPEATLYHMKESSLFVKRKGSFTEYERSYSLTLKTPEFINLSEYEVLRALQVSLMSHLIENTPEQVHECEFSIARIKL